MKKIQTKNKFHTIITTIICLFSILVTLLSLPYELKTSTSVMMLENYPWAVTSDLTKLFLIEQSSPSLQNKFFYYQLQNNLTYINNLNITQSDIAVFTSISVSDNYIVVGSHTGGSVMEDMSIYQNTGSIPQYSVPPTQRLQQNRVGTPFSQISKSGLFICDFSDQTIVRIRKKDGTFGAISKQLSNNQDSAINDCQISLNDQFVVYGGVAVPSGFRVFRYNPTTDNWINFQNVDYSSDSTQSVVGIQISSDALTVSVDLLSSVFIYTRGSISSVFTLKQKIDISSCSNSKQNGIRYISMNSDGLVLAISCFGSGKIYIYGKNSNGLYQKDPEQLSDTARSIQLAGDGSKLIARKYQSSGNGKINLYAIKCSLVFGSNCSLCTSSSCTCNISLGVYFNQQTFVCTKCHQTCKTCTGGLFHDCASCNPQYDFNVVLKTCTLRQTSNLLLILLLSIGIPILVVLLIILLYHCYQKYVKKQAQQQQPEKAQQGMIRQQPGSTKHIMAGQLQ